jgi:hypothetical protein
MRCLPYFVALVFSLIILSCNNANRKDKTRDAIDPKWKKIPGSWIKRAGNYSYAKTDTGLVAEFAKLISPDTVDHSGGRLVSDYGFMFNSVFVDLDGDNNNELLCLQGWNEYRPTLCVFKQVKGEWYLIYKEDIDTFYASPVLNIANNFSKNKVFSLRRVYDHGSGVYLDGVSFYKLIDNKVYKCLDIVNDAHIYGWGMFLNQSVKSRFEFKGDSDDELEVTYTYNFFPGAVDKKDCSWCAHEDVSLIAGEENMSYVYNDKKHTYALDKDYRNSALDLTPEKIACFGDFGNDSLFVKAYKRQIDTTIKIGSPIQKKLLKKYLAMVDKDKSARTEEIELKSKAGNTGFYGPKKK